MRKTFFLPAFGSAMAVCSSLAVSGEIVVLPGVVGPVGVVSGVDTRGPGILSVGNQNINTSNDAGGAITTDAANTASIVFAGTSTVTGFVGRTGSTFLNIAAGANANTVTFTGPVFSTTFSVSGTGTVNFNGGFTSNSGSTMDFAGNGFINVGAGQTVKAAITNSAGASTGTLTLNGNSILDGAVGASSGLKQINVVGGNALITGQARAAAYSLGTNTLNVAGAFAIPVAGVINTTIFSQSVYGRIVPVGAATIGNALQINVNVTGPINNGTSFNIIDATSGTSGSTVIATSNSTRYLFSAAPTTNGLVRITTTQVPLAVVVAPVVIPVTPGVVPVVVAPVIDALPLTPGTMPLLTAITLLPTATEVANALVQLGPGTTNLNSPLVSYRATQRFQEMWSARLAVCDDSGQPNRRDRPQLDDGLACESNEPRPHWWMSAFGYSGEQGALQGFDGYEARIFGAMIAVDTPLDDATRVGMGVRYARSKLEGEISISEGSIDSYQMTAYFSHTPGPWFTNAELVVGVDDYSASRRVAFTGVDATVNADINGHQFAAYGVTGYHFYVGDGLTTITPDATLQYTRVHVGSYNETDGGAVNLSVRTQNYDFVQAGLGLKLSRAVALSGTQVMRPEVHAKWLHSIGSETLQNTANFISGGPAFTTVGLKPSRDTYNVGAGVTFGSAGPFSIAGGYDYQWRNDKYKAHQGMIKFILSL
jgi:outer membrane autotransporter protein